MAFNKLVGYSELRQKMKVGGGGGSVEARSVGA